jgi:cytochrome P450
MEPTRLANRLLTFNVMFVIGMVYMFGHCVLDLYGCPDREDIISGLEAECKQVSATYDGLGSKEAVDRLYRIDSTIRESMRVSDVAVTALARDVVGKPLDLGNGIQIPKGTRIVFPTQAIHQDVDNYADPLRFDAFRFSRPFEGISTPNGSGGSSSNDRRSSGEGVGNGTRSGASGATVIGKDESERLCLTTITSSFLAFGYGKHACPGRWFATQTMKQALAGIVLNYDIEITNRPKTRQVLLNMMIPPTGAQMRFRRKVKR